VACGAYHTLVVAKQGTKLYSWGRNDLGQLGFDGSEAAYTPKDVTAGLSLGKRSIVQVSGGKMHSGMVVSGGRAYTWGGNEYGQLGVDYKVKNTAAANLVGELSGKTVAISCGYNQTLFLLEDGSLMACGSNNKGQLGVDEDTAIVDLPTEVKGIEGDVREKFYRDPKHPYLEFLCGGYHGQQSVHLGVDPHRSPQCSREDGLSGRTGCRGGSRGRSDLRA
jgi:alpha-tubulin suppressor-like RCC1 family protein